MATSPKLFIATTTAVLKAKQALSEFTPEFALSALEHGDAAIKTWVVKCFEVRKALIKESLRRESIKLENAKRVQLTARDINAIKHEIANLEQQIAQIQMEWRRFVKACAEDDPVNLQKLGIAYLDARQKEIASSKQNLWGVSAVFAKKHSEVHMLQGLERALRDCGRSPISASRFRG